MNLLGKLRAGFGGKRGSSSPTPLQFTDALGFNVPEAARPQYLQAAAARDAKAARADGDTGDDGMWTMIRNYDDGDDASTKDSDRATAYSKLAWTGVEPLSMEERPMVWYAAVGASELACDPDEQPYSYYEELSRTELDVRANRSHPRILMHCISTFLLICFSGFI